MESNRPNRARRRINNPGGSIVRIDWADFGDSVPAVEKKLLTPGFHAGKIAFVKTRPGDRVTEKNPSGDTLSIAVDFSTDAQPFDWVWHSVPANWTGRIVEIARCAGVEPPQRNSDEWDEQSLVGAAVYCETETYILQGGPNIGQERAKISQWVKPERQPKKTETTAERRARHDDNEVAPRPTKTRKPAKAATPEWESDDIPF
jgi:hypothetical protein